MRDTLVNPVPALQLSAARPHLYLIPIGHARID
jgi:hypothetical protein